MVPAMWIYIIPVRQANAKGRGSAVKTDYKKGG
jgi:hypothetical protein